MSEHTPGPWSYKHNGHYFDVGVIEEGRDMVYPDVCMGVRSCSEADARLIAAAPDLLSIAVTYVADCEDTFHDIEEMNAESKALYHAAKAAIKKARGE